VIRGRYDGNLAPVFQEIRKAWFAAVKGVKREEGWDMIALDVDEPLWHLSKNGCTHRGAGGLCPRKADCIGKEFCVTGVIKIDGKGRVVLDT